LFENLAISSGQEVYVDHYGRNGLYLDDHASSNETESKINEQNWDYVILQGGGPNTAYPEYFTDHPVYPALETLWNKIHQNCESTKMIFCLPWAFEDGMTWYQNWTDTYADMQIKIFENTIQYSEDIGFGIAPVGWSWYTALEEKNYPLHYLHMRDWNHPSLEGSYLMACVIFSTVFLKCSIDIPYYSDLLEEEGRYFQTVASQIVLNNLSLWNIMDEFDNDPPLTPDLPSGPNNGKPGETYSYTSTTYDPDDDKIYYKWSFGDGWESTWILPGLESGEMCEINHTWTEKGEYELKVKAMDEHGSESEWSDPLVLTIPKKRNLNSLIVDFIKKYLNDPLCLFIPTDSIEIKNNPYKINNKHFSEPSVIWNETYGGNLLDWGWSVQQTMDGGFIIGGETISFSSGSYDAFLIKTDKSGKEEWNKTFGGSAKDGCRAVIQTDDGGYILTGYADSYGYPGHDFWLIRTDENGDELWNYTFGGQSSDAAVSVIKTSDGDFVMAGYSYTNSYGGKDVWIVKTDENGDELWNYHYGGIGNDQGMSLVESNDGGYVIAGYTTSSGSGGTDMWLVKIDIDGGYEWDQCFGGSEDDWAGSIDLTLDGGYIISGDTKSYGNGGFDVWMIKTDSNGNEEWNQVFGEGSCHETGYCVKQTSDGGYIISGTKNTVNHDNALFIKTDSNGREEWNMTIFTDQSDIIYSICETEYNSFVSTGYTYTYGPGNMDIWLLNIGNINNQPPNKPTISGPHSGKINEEYNYSFVSTDDDGDDISYYIDWGDGTNIDWTRLKPSGESIYSSNVWTKKGNYIIKAKSKDIYGAESEWAELKVSMPINKVINNSFIIFLEQHLDMFPKLRQIFGL